MSVIGLILHPCIKKPRTEGVDKIMWWWLRFYQQPTTHATRRSTCRSGCVLLAILTRGGGERNEGGIQGGSDAWRMEGLQRCVCLVMSGLCGNTVHIGQECCVRGRVKLKFTHGLITYWSCDHQLLTFDGLLLSLKWDWSSYSPFYSVMLRPRSRGENNTPESAEKLQTSERVYIAYSTKLT